MESGRLHLDVINDTFLSKTNKLYHLDREVNSESDNYLDVLEIAKEYTIRYSFARHFVNGGNIYIKTAYEQDYKQFFKTKYTEVVRNKNAYARLREAAVKAPRRSKHLKDTDIFVDNAFYNRYTIPYNTLSNKEKKEFHGMKDMLHEELYGDISRFTLVPLKYSQDYIPNDLVLKSDFVLGLRRIVQDIKRMRVHGKDAHYIHQRRHYRC